MSAKDKAMELVDTYRIMLMNSDTDCGEEILCTVIAKYCALIAVDEIIKSKPTCVSSVFQGSFLTSDNTDYWEEVKKEIQLL
jgi:hypothetical protein